MKGYEDPYEGTYVPRDNYRSGGRRKFQMGGPQPTRSDSLEWNKLAEEFDISNSLLPPDGTITDKQADRLKMEYNRLWRHAFSNPLSEDSNNLSDKYPVRRYNDRPFMYGSLKRVVPEDISKKPSDKKTSERPRRHSTVKFQDTFYDDIPNQTRIHTDSYGNTTVSTWKKGEGFSEQTLDSYLEDPDIDMKPFLQRILNETGRRAQDTRKMEEGGPVQKNYKYDSSQPSLTSPEDLSNFHSLLWKEEKEFLDKWYPMKKNKKGKAGRKEFLDWYGEGFQQLLRDSGVPTASDVYFYPDLFPEWVEREDEIRRKMNPNKMHIFFDMRDKKQNGGYIPPPVSEEREKELLHKYIGNFVPYDKNPETGQNTISSEEMGPDHWLYDVSPTEGLDKRQAFYIMNRFANPLTRRPAPMQGPIAEEYINPEGEDRSEWLQKDRDSPLRRYDLDKNLKPQNPRRYEISNTYEMAYGGPRRLRKV